ncbi:MAG: AMP-binding protein [Caldilineaceae bacterium]
MNLHDLFAIPRKRNANKVAIEYKDEQGQTSTWTYELLHDAVDRLALGLQAWGLGKGDRVAFFLSNRPEFAIAYLAVIKIGAIMVPINLRYRKLEISHILADCAPKLLVTEHSLQSILDEVQGSIQMPALLYVDEWSRWVNSALHNPHSIIHENVGADDLALIMYTSGTTGRSKGAMISHNNVLTWVTTLLTAWAWEQNDRLLLCLPLFHVHGLVNGLHCALAAGATLLLRPQFEKEQTLAELCGDLPSGLPTVFFAVPTIYVRLVEELNYQLGTLHTPLAFSHMRLFCSGSAPLAAETMIEFERLTGHSILERYGMTETGMNLSNPYIGARVPGTVGLPLTGVSMRIIKPSNDKVLVDVASGEEGELLVRGSNVFLGYWNAPEKTASSFSNDASGVQWFHTGDLARQDPETGYVTLLGRRHELIISGGFNIYPREIEEMLTTFPGISEAAVVAMPHNEWGEVPSAYLVCSCSIDEGELVAYCRKQLASFKVPRKFTYVEALPRNAMGKIVKNLLPR